MVSIQLLCMYVCMYVTLYFIYYIILLFCDLISTNENKKIEFIFPFFTIIYQVKQSINIRLKQVKKII